MSMLAVPGLAPAPVELQVEAGSSAETILDIRGPSGADYDEPGAGDVELRVRGVPSAWYSLSEQRLHLQPDQTARVLLVVHPPAIEHGGEPGVYDLDLDVVADSGAVTSTRGRVTVLPPGAPLARGEHAPRSRLLDFLPRHHQGDEFLARFLLIFQVALDRIEHAIDNTHFLLDPGLTPPEFLTWLANWLDLDLSMTTDTESRRVLIERAVELYRWKGTRRGLRAELGLRLNARALIVENFDGLRLGQDAVMGINTQLGRRRDGCVTITVAGAEDADTDLQARTEHLLQSVEPAGCGYIVRCVAATRGTLGEY